LGGQDVRRLLFPILCRFLAARRYLPAFPGQFFSKILMALLPAIAINNPEVLHFWLHYISI